MREDKPQVQKDIPLLQSAIQRLEDEKNRFSNLNGQIKSKLMQIHQEPETKTEGAISDKAPEPSTALDMLNSLIYRIESENNYLQKIYNHLDKII